MITKVNTISYLNQYNFQDWLKAIMISYSAKTLDEKDTKNKIFPVKIRNLK